MRSAPYVYAQSENGPIHRSGHSPSLWVSPVVPGTWETKKWGPQKNIFDDHVKDVLHSSCACVDKKDGRGSHCNGCACLIDRCACDAAVSKVACELRWQPPP